MSGTGGKRSKPMEDGVWDCSVCTYKNSAEAFKCEMCDVRKGTSTRKPKPNSQLVAQQVVQQMASVSKKQTSKRMSERVDIGSDTSQDSHRSETRDSDILTTKTSPALVATTSQQHQLVNLPPSSTFASVLTPSPQPVTGTSQPSGAPGSGGDINAVTIGRHYHRCSNPTTKAISPLKTNGGGSSGVMLGSSGDDGEYISTPVTVKELTVIIHELVAPKVADLAPSSSLKVMNRSTKRKRTSLESAGGQNTNIDITTTSADCNPPPLKTKADWPTGDSGIVSAVLATTSETATDSLAGVPQSPRATPPSTPAFVPRTQPSPQLNDAPN